MSGFFGGGPYSFPFDSGVSNDNGFSFGPLFPGVLVRSVLMSLLDDGTAANCVFDIGWTAGPVLTAAEIRAAGRLVYGSNNRIATTSIDYELSGLSASVVLPIWQTVEVGFLFLSLHLNVSDAFASGVVGLDFAWPQPS